MFFAHLIVCFAHLVGNARCQAPQPGGEATAVFLRRLEKYGKILSFFSLEKSEK